MKKNQGKNALFPNFSVIGFGLCLLSVGFSAILARFCYPVGKKLLPSWENHFLQLGGISGVDGNRLSARWKIRFLAGENLFPRVVAKIDMEQRNAI